MAWRVRYISLFSGIEAATVAWESVGWEPLVFADFEAFPSAVLAHHYPQIPNLGDVTEVNWNEYRGKADLVVGGSPCQSFSVAGQRLGLADARGNLALHFLRVIEAVQPTWFVFENVPGLLSSDGGRDFATFLGEVAQLGYGFAYRILDAKHFGVAQRRRRVFVVGHIGAEWRRAAAVLFERESLCGDPTSRKAEGEGIATNAGSSPGEGSSTPSGTGGMNWDGEDTAKTLKANCRDQRMPDKGQFSGVIVGSLDTTDAEKWTSNQAIEQGKVFPVAQPVSDTITAKWSKGADSQSGKEGDGNILPVLSFDSTFGANSNVFEDETPQLKVGSSGSGMPPAIAFDWKNITQTNIQEESTDPITCEGSLAIGFSQNQREEVRDLEDTATTVKTPGTHESTMIAEVTTIRTGGPFDDPKLFINEPDDLVFLAANPMSDRKMAVFDARGNGDGETANTLVGDHQGRVTDYTAVAVEGVDLLNQEITGDEHAPLRTAQGHGAPAVAIQDTGARDKEQNGKGWNDEDTAYTLDAAATQGAKIGMAVRRLTPVECERLQGFPRNYTQIPWRKKVAEDCPDGHRFRALGNSMAVPVMRWLGQRIALVDAIPIEGEAHNIGTEWL